MDRRRRGGDRGTGGDHGGHEDGGEHQQYASTLLAAGVPLKTVSELPGHSSVSITADVCGHLTLEAKRDAVNRPGSLFATGGGSLKVW